MAPTVRVKLQYSNSKTNCFQNSILKTQMVASGTKRIAARKAHLRLSINNKWLPLDRGVPFT